jgi:hypothetical protein
MDKDLFPTLTSQIAASVVDGQAVIVLADFGQVTVLNELATHIWQICDGKHNIGQIVQDIVDKYEVEFSMAEQDVTVFLEQMIQMQALVLQKDP